MILYFEKMRSCVSLEWIVPKMSMSKQTMNYTVVFLNEKDQDIHRISTNERIFEACDIAIYPRVQAVFVEASNNVVKILKDKRTVLDLSKLRDNTRLFILSEKTLQGEKLPSF